MSDTHLYNKLLADLKADPNSFDHQAVWTALQNSERSYATVSRLVAKLEEKLDEERAEFKRELLALKVAASRMYKFVEWVKNAPVSSGVCCCGDSMTNHNGEHTAVDMWDNGLTGWITELHDDNRTQHEDDQA